MKSLRIRPIPFLFFFAIFSCEPSGNLEAPEVEAQEKVLQASQAWLALIDEEKLSQSWEQAGDMFRENIKREDWVNAVRQTREPLGKFKDRTLYNASYTTSLPTVPSGEYFVIQYQASYTQKSAIETITMSLGEDGTWRCIGYYIR